jgi:guanyl-specific ribonuclease Sa
MRPVETVPGNEKRGQRRMIGGGDIKYDIL